MRTFWKIALVACLASYMVLGMAAFSMYWWPRIPSAPRPQEGRVYALNNHGHYTYMNSSEYFLQRLAFTACPILLLTTAAILYFRDPFGELAGRRKYGSPPRDSR